MGTRLPDPSSRKRSSLCIAFALASTAGVIYCANFTIAAPAVGWLGWLAVGVIIGTGPLMTHAAYNFVGVAACAWSATMLGVWGWSEPGRDLVAVSVPGGGTRLMERPGEPYPILIKAGLPWSGFEGNGNGAAPGYIHWGLGLDAWLANWSVFLVLAWLAVCVLRVSFSRGSSLLLCGICALSGLLGGCRIVAIYD